MNFLFLLNIKMKLELMMEDYRGMFSSFWQKAYSVMFEGATTLIAMVHPQINMSYYSILGRIISHGYLATGVLPDRIALPTLIALLNGPDAIPQEIMIDALMDYISATERRSLKQALQASHSSHFPHTILDEITTILSRFGCRQISKPSTLMTDITNIAVYEFCTKPAAAIALLHSGLPFRHKEFWSKKKPNEIQFLHHRLSANPSKVISMLGLEVCASQSEERI